MDEEQVGGLVAALLQDPTRMRHVESFRDPDLNYLTCRAGLEANYVAYCLRVFGRSVVIESLRRTEPGWSPRIFWGICRNVERQQ
jgi:hypothetical protein